MADANLLQEFLSPVFDGALATGVLNAAARGYDSLRSYIEDKDLSLLFKKPHQKIFERALHEVAGDKTPLLREMILVIKTDEGFAQALYEFQISRDRPADEFLRKLFARGLPAASDNQIAGYVKTFLIELRKQIAANPKLFPDEALKMLDTILSEVHAEGKLTREVVRDEGEHTRTMIGKKLDDVLDTVKTRKSSGKNRKESHPNPEESHPLDWRVLHKIFHDDYKLHQLDFGHLETGERLQHKLDLQRVYIRLSAKDRFHGALMKAAGVQTLNAQQARQIPRLLQRFDEMLHTESEKFVRLLQQPADEGLLKIVARKIMDECAARNLRECDTILGELVRSTRQAREKVLFCLHELSRQSTVPTPLAKILQKGRTQILIGDAGCGKTTLLRYVALQAFADLPAGRMQALHEEFGLAGVPPIPIYFRLEDFATKAPANLDELLDCAARFYQQVGAASITAAHVHHALQNQCVWLLLDGLDEVSEAQTRLALAKILNALASDENLPNLRLTLTSRPAAISDELLDLLGAPDYRLMDLEWPQIEEFAKKYFAANLDEKPEQSEQRARGFLSALEDVPAARELATNPLLLTVIAVLHYRSGRLPRFRAELYEKCIEQLMTQKAKKPGQPSPEELQFVFPAHATRKSDELVRLKYDNLTVLLRDLAFHAHARQRDEVYLTPRLVKERLLELKLIDKKWDSISDLEQVGKALLNFCEQPIGLLAFRSGSFMFVHRTFQEYLAAHYLSQRADGPLKDKFVPLLLSNPAHWSEVLRLFFGRMIKERPDTAGDLFEHLILPRCMADGMVFITLAAQCLADMEERGPLADVHEQTTHKFITLRNGAYDNPPLLLQCGKALSLINEPRLYPADPPDPPDPWDLPLALLGGGEFTMGADPEDDSEAGSDETPHRVRLSPFAISRYPMTNLQFAEFMQARGYENDRCWSDTKECREFLRELRKKKTLYPSEWYTAEFGHDRTHAPVVGVSWYEAVAYCNWWTQQYAQEWLQRHGDWLPNAKAVHMLLPTEAQWEYAARRDTGRKYPWRNEPLSPSRLNYNNKIKTTTEVGSYPQGATPEGTEDQKIFDLGGNVWEWCRDWYQEDFYKKCLKQQPSEAPCCETVSESRVVRGGSWVRLDPRVFRAAFRLRNLPHDRDRVLGFRVVVVPQS